MFYIADLINKTYNPIDKNNSIYLRGNSKPSRFVKEKLKK